MTPRSMSMVLALLALAGAAAADHGFEHPTEDGDDACRDGAHISRMSSTSTFIQFEELDGDYAGYAVYRAEYGSGDAMEAVAFVEADPEDDTITLIDDTNEAGVSYTYRIRGEGSAHAGVSEPYCGVSSDLACPTVTATEVDGTVVLTWDEVEGAEEYVVFENQELGAPPRFRQYEEVARTELTTYTDTDPVGPWIVVAALEGETVDTRCDEVFAGTTGGGDGDEETEIPFFPAPVFAAVAVVGAVGAYTAMRRR